VTSLNILPARSGGRGTAPRSGGVEEHRPARFVQPLFPSTILRMVPLPTSGEDLR